MTVTVSAKAGNAAEISIFGEIKSDAAADFDRDLKALGNVRQIALHIHSGGGNLFAALSIYNALKRHPARIVAYIDGVAASAASFIAMAADEIRISANGQIMIHDPSAAVHGGSDDMARMGRLLDNLRDTMVGAYAERSGISRARVQELMAAETWLTADEAVEAGFADVIDEPVKVAAIDLSGLGFKHVPAPQSIAEYSDAYWSNRNKPVEDSSAQAEVEGTSHGESGAPDLVVAELDPAEIFEGWNKLSPQARAQRGDSK